MEQVRKIPCRLVDAEEIIAEMDLMDVADDVMESDEDYQIVISGWWVYIPELELNLHEGIFCNYEKEEQAYLPDFSITIVSENPGEEIKEGDWLYYEQDGFVISLLNYLHGVRMYKNMDMSHLEQVKCFICIPQADISDHTEDLPEKPNESAL